jgi:RNA polymerase sigma factor (TIGR02999 family)
MSAGSVFSEGNVTTGVEGLAMTSPGHITLLLSQTNDPDSLAAVMRLTYEEMRGIARKYIRREHRKPSWQPTDLLNETCLRLMRIREPFENRRHFFLAAAATMRHLIIDRVRRRRARVRGGDWQRVDFSEAERVGFADPGELLDFHDALGRLKTVNPVWSAAVELRVFGGWSHAEVATIMGIGESTARRYWSRGLNWLREALVEQ